MPSIRSRRARLAVTISMTLFIGAVVLAVRNLHPPSAGARSSGLPGYSGNPATNEGRTCAQCHSGGIAPTVIIEGPDRLERNAEARYRLIVSGGQAVAAGAGISVDSGLLSVLDGDSDVRIADGEVVHTVPMAIDDAGRAIFEFLFQAPSSGAAITIYAAGNSVDGDGSTAGDMPAATRFEVSIVEGPTTTPARVTPPRPRPSSTPSPSVTATEPPLLLPLLERSGVDPRIDAVTLTAAANQTATALAIRRATERLIRTATASAAGTATARAPVAGTQTAEAGALLTATADAIIHLTQTAAAATPTEPVSTPTPGMGCPIPRQICPICPGCTSTPVPGEGTPTLCPLCRPR